jgi:mannose-6-phosphate isomerase
MNARLSTDGNPLRGEETMEKTPLYPMLLDPALHVKVWGGRRLETLMHKRLPTAEPYGESWEMHDTSKVANGALAGQTLGDLLKQYGADLIGGLSDPSEGMPLLVKILDATDWLSVQVHPNDEQARELEGEPRGKTEAWYILAADEKAELVIGVTPDASAKEVADAIRANHFEDMLVYEPVEAGDVLYIPAGTIHALGPGLLVYEIQQSSDTTYRLYDWGRMGLDGQPRPLHVEKSLKVARLGKLPSITFIAGERDTEVEVVNSPFFKTVMHQLRGNSVDLATGGVFQALTCIEGEAEVSTNHEAIAMQTGQTVLIPAIIGSYKVTGTAKILRSYQTA